MDKRIKAYNLGPNPYTWFTIEALNETWRNLQKIVKERNLELEKEYIRQLDNDKQRQEFASVANNFHDWISKMRYALMDTQGNLEEQLKSLEAKTIELASKREELKKIEKLGTALEEQLILENKYTNHSVLSLNQAYDQLNQLALRMQNNLKQQLQAKSLSGVSEESLKEFTMMFKHFDRDRVGHLNHKDFKSCMRALGYDLPMVEEGQKDVEFEEILDVVDPSRSGHVYLMDFIAMMISKETDNISSMDEIINAFRAITNDRPYITIEELNAVSPFLSFSYFSFH